MINQFYKIKLSPMLRYLLNSIFVTIIDTCIVWTLYRIMAVDIILSNSAGVIIGFIIHYLISSKSVFDIDLGTQGFIVYLTTFLMGLAMADWLIFLGENYLFLAFYDNQSFLFSKGLSIVIPFFFLYFIRRILFDFLKSNKKRPS